MKKSMRKMLSMLLMVVMVFAMTADVFATGNTHAITINGNTGHSYSAYQVFTGNLNEDKDKLSNIEWGRGVNGDALLTDLKSAAAPNPYADCNTAADVAGILQGFSNDSEGIDAFATVVGKHLTATAGTSTESAGTEGKAVYKISGLGDGYYFLKDTSDAMPEKDTRSKYMLKIKDDIEITAKDSVVTSEKKVKDANDTTGEVTGWQDSADYDIGDSVPFLLKAKLPSNFESYKSFSLTFHDYEVDGKLDLIEDTIKVKIGDSEITSGYTVETTGGDNNTFKVHFDDLRNIEGAKNNSVITVEYSSILTADANIGAAGNVNKMHVTYSTDLYKDSDNPEDGKTPVDKVIVFTYKTVINKVDQNNDPLAGANFKLEKKAADGTWTAQEADITSSTNGQNDVFTFTGIDDGEYRLVETAIPDGYNGMDDIYFKVTAEHEELSADPQLISLSGSKDDGEVFFDSDKANGTLSKSIVNRQGLVLPSTGGIGTTIFYIAGLLLVIGAAVVFITKRRMNSGR